MSAHCSLVFIKFCSIAFLLLSLFLFYSLWVSQTSFDWWSFTEVLLTASLLRTLQSILADLDNAVVCMFLIWSSILQSLFFSFCLGLWQPFQVCQLLLVSLSLSFFIAFSTLWQYPSICLSLCFLSFPFCGQWEQQNPLDAFFILINFKSGLLARIRKFICISKSQII